MASTKDSTISSVRTMWPTPCAGGVPVGVRGVCFVVMITGMTVGLEGGEVHYLVGRCFVVVIPSVGKWVAGGTRGRPVPHFLFVWCELYLVA